MTKLQEEICRILDFDPNNYWATAWKEAVDKEKLVNTWMRVNGKAMFVNKFYPDQNLMYVSNNSQSTHEVAVESLDVFLPETGMYSDGKSCLYLTKNPLKQWKKSFHPGFYGFSWVSKEAGLYSEEFLDTAKLVPFFVSSGGAVYKNKNKIGTAKDGVIELTDYNFYQDVVDWVTKENLEWKIQ